MRGNFSKKCLIQIFLQESTPVTSEQCCWCAEIYGFRWTEAEMFYFSVRTENRDLRFSGFLGSTILLRNRLTTLHVGLVVHRFSPTRYLQILVTFSELLVNFQFADMSPMTLLLIKRICSENFTIT